MNNGITLSPYDTFDKRVIDDKIVNVSYHEPDWAVCFGNKSQRTEQYDTKTVYTYDELTGRIKKRDDFENSLPPRLRSKLFLVVKQ